MTSSSNSSKISSNRKNRLYTRGVPWYQNRAKSIILIVTQVVQLEEECRSLKRTNENLTRDAAQQRQIIEDRDQAATRMCVDTLFGLFLSVLRISCPCRKEEINQLEEKVSRLEGEKLELLDNIQKGEGMIDTAIQQLQQENVNWFSNLLMKCYFT